MTQLEQLRIFVDLRDRTLQKTRIAFGNRVGAIERGEDQADPVILELLSQWHDRFRELEDEVDKDIKQLAKGVDIIDQAVAVKGCGFVNVAKVLGLMPEISSMETVSQMWRVAGYAVIDGKAERLKKGETAHFNKRLKIACRLVGISMLKSNSPYRDEYDRARECYDRTHPEWTDLHKYNAALRKMIKLWLSHLWETWREIEGLPIRPPYILNGKGHTTHKSRFAYGWSENGL